MEFGYRCKGEKTLLPSVIPPLFDRSRLPIAQLWWQRVMDPCPLQALVLLLRAGSGEDSAVKHKFPAAFLLQSRVTHHGGRCFAFDQYHSDLCRWSPHSLNSHRAIPAGAPSPLWLDRKKRFLVAHRLGLAVTDNAWCGLAFPCLPANPGWRPC